MIKIVPTFSCGDDDDDDDTVDDVLEFDDHDELELETDTVVVVGLETFRVLDDDSGIITVVTRLESAIVSVVVVSAVVPVVVLVAVQLL